MTTTASTAPTPRQIAGMKRSNRYKGLTEDLHLTPEQALSVMLREPATDEPETPLDPNVAELIALGFSAEEAATIVEDDDDPEPPATPAPEPPAPLTPKEQAEALVVEKGLTFTRGRVYLTKHTIEAAVRVGKTGTPEVIHSSGVGHIKAVLLYREDTGDVAAQNLGEKKAA